MDETGVKVPTIIPNHNPERTVGPCPQMAYDQTAAPFEVIVADDCSADSSGDVARCFPGTLVELPTNRGTAAARDAGVAASSGEVLLSPLSPSLLVVPAALLGIFLITERHLTAFLRRKRGPGYRAVFAGLHHLVYVVARSGAAAGRRGWAVRAVAAR